MLEQPVLDVQLTLSVNEAAIRRARRYSMRHGTSMSELVSRFLGSLEDEPKSATPIVSRVRGILPLDVLADRKPHADDAAFVLSVILLRRHLGLRKARRALADLLKLVKSCPSIMTGFSMRWR